MLLLALAGGGLRLAVLERNHPVGLVGDEYYYAVVAENLAQGRGHVLADGWARAWRPPAHPFLLSQVVDSEHSFDPRDPGAFVLPLLYWQILISMLLLVATGWLGWVMFDARVGLLAAAVLAIDPSFVAYSHSLWSEPLFAAVVTLALAMAVRVRDRPSLGGVVATGVLFGVATLTRELALGIGGLVALWWIFEARTTEPRAALQRGALALGLALLVVAPWTLRNYSLLGRFVPVGTVGWYAVAEGNTLDHPNWFAPIGPAGFAFKDRYMAIPDELERTDFARAWAFERIAAEQPLWILRKVARTVGQLLSPKSVLFYKLERGAYGSVSLDAVRILFAFSVLVTAGIVAAGLLGIATRPEKGRRAMAVLILSAVFALHVVANASPRFRMPWMPLLSVFAAAAVLDLRGAWERLTPQGRAVWGALLVGLVGGATWYSADWVAALWREGTAARSAPGPT